MGIEDFNKLCQAHKVIKISGDSHDIVVTFDNGVIVTASADTEWESPCINYDSSIEQEARKKKWEAERQAEQNRKDLALQQLEEIRSKYTPEQWDEIQKVFKNR